MPWKHTHNIGGIDPQKMYELGEKYSDLAPVEEWKKELVMSSIASKMADVETFRDRADDSENVRKGVQAWLDLDYEAGCSTSSKIYVDCCR